MGYATIVAEDLGGGRYNLQAHYQCCERGNEPNACVHVPAGRLFDLESPAHLAIGMLMKKYAPKLGRAVPQKDIHVSETGVVSLTEVPRDKNILKKKKRVRGLV